MSFGRKRNMSKRWLRKNTPGTGKRGRPIDRYGPVRTTTDCTIWNYHFFRTEKDSKTERESRK